MKRKLILTSLSAVAFMALFINACKKEDKDTAAPTVAINGAASVTVILQTASWPDPGATAHDENDGNLAVTSSYSSTNPNLSQAGNYTITYTARDAAGNTGSATRTVKVYNEADVYVGTYNVKDTVDGVGYAYTQQITADNAFNKRIHFSKFRNFGNNGNVYANMVSSNRIVIPNQTVTNVTDATAIPSCTTTDRVFRSDTSANILNGFEIAYIDSILVPGACYVKTLAGVAQFTK